MILMWCFAFSVGALLTILARKAYKLLFEVRATSAAERSRFQQKMATQAIVAEELFESLRDESVGRRQRLDNTFELLSTAYRVGRVNEFAYEHWRLMIARWRLEDARREEQCPAPAPTPEDSKVDAWSILSDEGTV